MMTVQEAAAKWGVDENTVRKWARSGKVKATPLSEVLRARGLPAPKRDSWMIDQNDRPALDVGPIERAKAVPENPGSEEEPVNGDW